MTQESMDAPQQVKQPRSERLERFIERVKSKTTNPVHLRLLEAHVDASGRSMENELRAIIDETIHET